MTPKKHILFIAFGILFACLALQGTSWAANPVTKERRLVVDVWTWHNPLEGVQYNMAQFADGTIVAIRQRKVLTSSEKIYTVQPDKKPTTTSPTTSPRDAKTRDFIQDSLDADMVYDLWKQRRISCVAKRNTPDLFGNIFEVCQAAPFKFETQNGESTSDRGVVWIFVPPASGKQETAPRGSQPSWGR